MCLGETFVALVKGLQGALWELGGVPRLVRSDNLSAATHELRDSRGRAMNAKYEAVLAHYGVESSRTNPRSSHENGVVEQRHRRLKSAIDQALILRGSRDFESEDEHRTFVRRVVDRRNRLVDSKLRQRTPSSPTAAACSLCRSTSTTERGCVDGAPSGWRSGRTRYRLG